MPNRKVIICPECIIENNIKISEEENQPSNEDDLVPLDKPHRVVMQLATWQDYAYHILEKHPTSERVRWAELCLTELGEPLKRGGKKTTPKPKTEDKPVIIKVPLWKKLLRRSPLKRDGKKPEKVKAKEVIEEPEEEPELELVPNTNEKPLEKVVPNPDKSAEALERIKPRLLELMNQFAEENNLNLEPQEPVTKTKTPQEPKKSLWSRIKQLMKH